MRWAILAVMVLSAACGGSSAKSGSGASPTSERVLHLSTGDYTENEIRTAVAVEIGTPSAAAIGLCRAIVSMSDADALAAIKAQGVVSTQIRTPNAEDDLRQAQLFKEACARVAH